MKNFEHERIPSLLIVTLVFLSSVLTGQPESWYINRIAHQLEGRTEVEVSNGRVDIVTADYAIEVERAANWKHSIGQSLWYALQTERKPGIVLIITSIEERIHGIRLQSALEYAGLGDKITVWNYPEDFNTTIDRMQEEFIEELNADPAATGFWLSTNSNVRHNARCQWYTVSRGRYCTALEGRACGQCGG